MHINSSRLYCNMMFVISTLVQEVLNKMKQNKNKSFSMNENYIIWKMFKLIKPKWGFTYPTGNISSWNLSKAKNLHNFAKCHCSSMCEEIKFIFTEYSWLHWAIWKHFKNKYRISFNLNFWIMILLEHALSSQKLV